jgi:uncharacterized protein YjiS (DUF1127 family)
MTAIDRRLGAPSLLDRFDRWLNRYAENRAQREAYLRTLRELHALGPRELDDLGIPRGDIARVAREAVYGV